jgi:uncharacterized iron-regulated membrane protein
MRASRTLLFWLHLSAGVSAGAIILIMSATGAVLALKPQILNRIDRDVRFVEPASSAQLSPSLIVAAVRIARPDAAVASIAIDRDPKAAVAVGMGRGGTVYVDPYTGDVLGGGSETAESFFRSVENWHRWLAVGAEGRATARTVTGAANLAFLVLAISGLYIWWPRKWTPQHARPIVWFTRSRTGRARDFNWHNVIGFWCAPAIIVMTFSGVVMSYPWANGLLYRALGSTPPTPAGERGGGPGGGRGGAAPPIVPESLDALVRRAEEQLRTWRTIAARFPNRAEAPVAFTLSDGASWNRFARSQLTLDPVTAGVRQWQPYDSNSLGQKARGWLRFAHTGELAGLPGQLIAGLGCLGGVMLVWTGISLAIRRFFAWKIWTPARARAVVVESGDPLFVQRLMDE